MSTPPLFPRILQNFNYLFVSISHDFHGIYLMNIFFKKKSIGSLDLLNKFDEEQLSKVRIVLSSTDIEKLNNMDR